MLWVEKNQFLWCSWLSANGGWVALCRTCKFSKWRWSKLLQKISTTNIFLLPSHNHWTVLLNCNFMFDMLFAPQVVNLSAGFVKHVKHKEHNFDTISLYLFEKKLKHLNFVETFFLEEPWKPFNNQANLMTSSRDVVYWKSWYLVFKVWVVKWNWLWNLKWQIEWLSVCVAVSIFNYLSKWKTSVNIYNKNSKKGIRGWTEIVRLAHEF